MTLVTEQNQNQNCIFFICRVTKLFFIVHLRHEILPRKEVLYLIFGEWEEREKKKRCIIWLIHMICENSYSHPSIGRNSNQIWSSLNTFIWEWSSFWLIFNISLKQLNVCISFTLSFIPLFCVFHIHREADKCVEIHNKQKPRDRDRERENRREKSVFALNHNVYIRSLLVSYECVCCRNLPWECDQQRQLCADYKRNEISKLLLSPSSIHNTHSISLSLC